MKPFLSDDFLLQTQTASTLYHQFAKNMPIYDYHCHLPVREIAENKKFENLTQIWLNDDHYKWRAMRANGVDEDFITGNRSDFEKFQAWAATVPKTIGNPLYQWTHLELKRYFGIDRTILNQDTAKDIYDHCTKLLQSNAFSAREILKRMDVRLICTTDDPVDSLKYHRQLENILDFPVRVLPAFRPDKAMAVESPEDFNAWVDRLEAAADMDILNYKTYVAALRQRHDFFHQAGCRLSDHGIERPFAENYTDAQIQGIFERARSGQMVKDSEIRQFKSAMLIDLAVMDAEKGWTQQFHLGALRNVNTRAMQRLGPDSGYDTIGDFEMAQPLARFLDRLENQGKLAKTILYVVNPRNNEMIAAMIGNFQDGSIPGKIQFGSAWWYNDQKDGMEAQIKTLANMGLLSRFVGMLTDSRSFLSYPRHEYFRRILCNLLGNDVENGELP
ncbi:MAG: glucuronate isomerase, partial [Desulfobacterales bacterium]